jgi:hypothetical protein
VAVILLIERLTMRARFLPTLLVLAGLVWASAAVPWAPRCQIAFRLDVVKVFCASYSFLTASSGGLRRGCAESCHTNLPEPPSASDCFC